VLAAKGAYVAAIGAEATISAPTTSADQNVT
jgi:hypothetical protein